MPSTSSSAAAVSHARRKARRRAWQPLRPRPPKPSPRPRRRAPSPSPDRTDLLLADQLSRWSLLPWRPPLRSRPRDLGLNHAQCQFFHACLSSSHNPESYGPPVNTVLGDLHVTGGASAGAGAAVNADRACAAATSLALHESICPCWYPCALRPLRSSYRRSPGC